MQHGGFSEPLQFSSRRSRTTPRAHSRQTPQRAGLMKLKRRVPRIASRAMSFVCIRACPKIARGPAARDFGCGQGGEVRASPTRAVRTEPTQATDKRPAARRVFAPKAAWLRCSSVEDPGRIFSFVAPRHPAFGAKTGPRGIFGHALRWCVSRLHSVTRSPRRTPANILKKYPLPLDRTPVAALHQSRRKRPFDEGFLSKREHGARALDRGTPLSTPCR